MGSHKSKDCSKKISPSQHSCAKCYNSNVSAEKDDYRSHNATDPLCPVCVREVYIELQTTLIIYNQKTSCEKGC